MKTNWEVRQNSSLFAQMKTIAKLAIAKLASSGEEILLVLFLHMEKKDCEIVVSEWILHWQKNMELQTFVFILLTFLPWSYSRLGTQREDIFVCLCNLQFTNFRHLHLAPPE